jgi:hypothetical protein
LPNAVSALRLVLAPVLLALAYYATGNYFAADYDLGYPEGHMSPSAEGDLHALVARAHACGIPSSSTW